MDVVKECTEFISTAYGHKSSSMTTARQAVWDKKAGSSSLLLAPKLESFPPTTATFIENVKRAHLQAVIWNHALSPSKPDINPMNFGYIFDAKTNNLQPVNISKSEKKFYQSGCLILCVDHAAVTFLANLNDVAAIGKTCPVLISANAEMIAVSTHSV